MKNYEVPTAQDLKIIEQQLGRTPRDVLAIAHRCECGAPDVITTPPRLSDGTPFPTFFYATCPKLTAALSTLESAGLMEEFNLEISSDENAQKQYLNAHQQYISERNEQMQKLNQDVPEVLNISAGGMPERVKCLHALAAQSLAQGEGANTFGDRTIAKLPKWWCDTPCQTLIG